MPLRTSLRTALLTAVALGAVCVPATAAVADSSPKPVATPSAAPAEPSPSVSVPGEEPTAVPSTPSDATPTVVPRGGVAAGEEPSGSSDGALSTATLTSAGVAALLVAGAGTVVLRRRAARRDG